MASEIVSRIEERCIKFVHCNCESLDIPYCQHCLIPEINNPQLDIAENPHRKRSDQKLSHPGKKADRNRDQHDEDPPMDGTVDRSQGKRCARHGEMDGRGI